MSTDLVPVSTASEQELTQLAVLLGDGPAAAEDAGDGDGRPPLRPGPAAEARGGDPQLRPVHHPRRPAACRAPVAGCSTASSWSTGPVGGPAVGRHRAGVAQGHDAPVRLPRPVRVARAGMRSTRRRWRSRSPSAWRCGGRSTSPGCRCWRNGRSGSRTTTSKSTASSRRMRPAIKATHSRGVRHNRRPGGDHPGAAQETVGAVEARRHGKHRRREGVDVVAARRRSLSPPTADAGADVAFCWMS